MLIVSNSFYTSVGLNNGLQSSLCMLFYTKISIFADVTTYILLFECIYWIGCNDHFQEPDNQ